MCLEEFFTKHPEALELFKQKMTESYDETSGQTAHPRRDPPQMKGWDKPYKKDGHFPHGKPEHWHLMDFSKFQNCSMDMDCNGMWKCCQTMCGKRCIKPMFEYPTWIEKSESQSFDNGDGKEASTPEKKYEEEKPEQKEENAVEELPPNQQNLEQTPAKKEENTVEELPTNQQNGEKTPAQKEENTEEEPPPNQQNGEQPPAQKEENTEEPSPNQ
ncbi:uncharacterized protein LOC144769757 [Lissotriton helveticus]